MAMTSTAEARLDARIRPEITAMRGRTSYPRRSRTWSDASASDARESAVAGPGAAAPGAAGPGAAGQGTALRAVAGVTAPARARAAGAATPGKPSAPAGPVAVGGEPGLVRLTRRGRMVVGAVAVAGAVITAAILWFALAGRAQASSQAPGGQPARGGLARIVVRPGQTLWSIAVRSDPSADPRIIIAEIMDENALSGTAIRAGQVLWVPRS